MLELAQMILDQGLQLRLRREIVQSSPPFETPARWAHRVSEAAGPAYSVPRPPHGGIFPANSRA